MALFGPPNINKLKARNDVQALLKALDYRKNEETRYKAVEALGELREETVVELFLALLEDDDFKNREPIIEALGRIGDERAVPQLIHRIKNQGASSSPSEIAALLSIGISAADPLMELLRDKNTDTKDSITILNSLEKIDGESLSNDLLGLLDHGNPSLIPHLAEFLGRLGEIRAIPHLVSILKSAPEDPGAARVVAVLKKLGWKPSDVQEEAALSLSERNWDRLREIGNQSIEYLLPLLRKGRASEIVKAIKLLEKFGDERAVEPITSLLEDKRSEIAAASVRALGVLGTARAAEALVEKVMDSNDPMVSSEAEKALIRLGKSAVTLLIDQLHSSDTGERKKAVRILGRIGDPSALHPLVSAMDDRSLYPELQVTLEKLGWKPSGS
ncbi:HEAT repeat domain-containing protein [Acidobacteriota bacterium]